MQDNNNDKINENLSIELNDDNTEHVELATVYIKNNKMGLQFHEDANVLEILYFLEALCKVEREEYEDKFREYYKG